MSYTDLSIPELIELIEAKDAEIEILKKKLVSYHNERRLRQVKQAAGIRKAKDSGIQFGRPRKEAPDKFLKVKAIYDNHLINIKEAAKLLQVSPSTFIRWMKEYNEIASPN